MKKINKSVLVIEGGLFQSFAHRLARDFVQVLYWRPWVNSFSHPNDRYIGSGYDDIQRVDSWLDYIDDVDIFAFPDIGYASEQEYLRSLGKNVWGSGNGEELEMLRAETKTLMEELKLPVQPWEVVTGMKALRSFIQKNPGWHVKVSTVRGLTESFHAIEYGLVKPKLDSIEHELGGRAEVQEFIVEQGIPDAIETGYDGYFVGDFPKTAQVGIEVKDAGFTCALVPYTRLPRQVREVNDKLKDTLVKYRYAGSISTEVRISGGKGYCIDFTCRSASPAGETQQELFTNFSQIVDAASQGELIEPEFKDKFAAQAMLTSSFAEENWLPITIPPAIRDNVKLYHSCMVDGQEYIVPGEYDMAEIGSVVATGRTLDEAIKKVSEYSDQIKAFGLKCRTDVLESSKADLLKAMGGSL